MARAPQPPPQPPQQTNLNDGIVLDKFTGLKNTVEPERLSQNELQTAINIDIDDTGQIHRRRGRKLVMSGNWSNLWQTNEGLVFAVKNGSFGVVNPNYSFTALASGYPTDQIAYEQIGKTLYFSSRTKSGKVDLTTSPPTLAPWGVLQQMWLSPVVNPTATLPPIRGKLLGPPPLATDICYYNGRMYLAQGKVLWCTELYTYDYVDTTRTYFYYEDEITVIFAVADGVYVGTTTGLWFQSGASIREMGRRRVGDSGVTPNSAVYVPGELGNPGVFNVETGLREDTGVKPSVLLMTAGGFCGCQDGGVVYNFTEDKFIFPDMTNAAAIWRRQDGMNQYLVAGNSQGTPAQSARIGDYVDATIIRGSQGTVFWATITEGLAATNITQPGNLATSTVTLQPESCPSGLFFGDQASYT